MIVVGPGPGGGGDGVDGGGGNESVTLHGKSFKITGAATFEPEYVSNLELDLSAKSESITDQCGRTEIRKNGDTNWTLSAEGIISDAQLGNFKSVARIDDTVTATTIMHSGEMTVDTATLTQREDDVFIEFINGGTDGMAIHFQMQLKQPSSEQGGGVVPNFS